MSSARGIAPGKHFKIVPGQHCFNNVFRAFAQGRVGSQKKLSYAVKFRPYPARACLCQQGLPYPAQKGFGQGQQQARAVSAASASHTASVAQSGERCNRFFHQYVRGRAIQASDKPHSAGVVFAG